MKNKLLLLILFSAINAISQSGETDTTFGTNGKVTTGFGSNQNAANAIAFQPDGKFLVGGYYTSNHGDSDFALARYNSDGSLDTAFGTGGKTVTDFLELANNLNFITGIYVLPNGKIIVLGLLGSNGFLGPLALVRYNSDGTIDTSFGINGKAVTELSTYYQYGSKLIIQADGKLIVSANHHIYNEPDRFGIQRYTQDGQPDTAFGTEGKVITSFGTGQSLASSIIQKADGKFIVAGTYTATNSPQIAVAQYNADGTLDTSFDGDGKVITNFGPNTVSAPMQVSITQEGKLKVAGFVGTTVTNFGLVQYNANGSLDTSFDGDGKALSPIPQPGLFGILINYIAMQPDGKYLLVADSYEGESVLSTNFVALRFNADSTPDLTFGIDAKVSTTIDTGLNLAKSAAVTPEGEIFVVGKAGPSGQVNQSDFAIVKYNSNGNLDTSLSGDGKVTTGFEKSDDILSRLLVLPDDKLVAIGTSEYRQLNGEYFKNIALSKYNSDGSPDTSFGNSGKVVSVFGENVNQVTTAAAQANGKIVLGNRYSNLSQTGYFAELIRYNADGNLDNDFGTNGKVSLNFFPHYITFQTDGKMLVAGAATINSVNQYFITRYETNGNLDTSFDSDGQLIFSFGQSNSGAASILIQPDSKIILYASSSDPAINNGSMTFSTARFDSNGSLDISFGDNGKVSTLIGNYGYAYAGHLQADNKIIIVGMSDGYYFSSVRYESNGTLDPTYGTAGILTSPLLVGYHHINSVLPQSDGKFVLVLGPDIQLSDDSDFKIARYNPDGTFDDDLGGSSGISASFYTGYDESFAVGLQSDNKIIVGGATDNSISTDFALTRYSNTILDTELFTNAAADLAIYPNPVKHSLNVKGMGVNASQIIGFSIYTMLGQLVYKSSRANQEADVSNLTNGIYTVVIQTDRGSVSKKFVKE